MSYGINLSPEAQEDLSRLPLAVRRFALNQLLNLSESPTALSRKSHFPYFEKCQLMTFDFDHDGQRHFCNILFQYGQDELTLYIIAISVQAAGKWYE
jgi:hypothetical protein